MAFTKKGLQVNRGTTSANAQGNGVSTTIHGYLTNDSITVITTLNYFPPNFSLPDSGSPNISVQPNADEIFANDFLLVKSPDGVGLFLITSVNPVALGGNLLIGAGGISISSPIAPIDNNAIAINFGALVAEFADGTHNGILSTTTQTIAGAKTFSNAANINGVAIQNNLLNIGTPNVNWFYDPGVTTVYENYAPSTYLAFNTSSNVLTLNTSAGVQFSSSPTGISFINNSVTMSWTGPWASTLTSTLEAHIINSSVTIIVKAVAATAVTSSALINSVTQLPVAYRPAATRNSIIRVINNSAAAVGSVQIASTGQITIGSDVAGSNFTNSGNAAFSDWTFTYLL